MCVLLKIDSSPPYWSPVSKSFPSPILDLSLKTTVVTLSSSTTISSLVLLSRVLLDLTYCLIHGVLNILDSYLVVVFLQTGCGNFSFFTSMSENNFIYTRYVHGQRVICSTPEMIQVLDFARPTHPLSPRASKKILRSNPSRIMKVDGDEFLFSRLMLLKIWIYTCLLCSHVI